MQILTPGAAAARIGSHTTVALSGGYCTVPETLFRAIAARFAAERAPAGLTVVSVSMLERSRGGVGGEDTGMQRLALPGLMSTLISSSFGRGRNRALTRLIANDELAAYNLPMGTIVQLLRTIGAGRPGLATAVGIGTFVDPRVDAARMNKAAVRPLCSVIEFGGEEMLYYPRFGVDFGIVKASAADERGNLYFDLEVYDHGAIDVAIAVKGSGGVVLAEVNRLVRRGELPARMVRVPGAMVDAVVVSEDEPYGDEQSPVLLGRTLIELPPPSAELRVRDVIATLALQRLPVGAIVNLGAGIPVYDLPEAARRTGRDDLFFTIEQGPTGGWPQVGGVSRNPEAILGQSEVFDFYEGGGPQVSVLGFGEIDADGNVNVSRFGAMMPGCGGFINIVHGVRNLVFCGTMTTGGLNMNVTDGRLNIVQEGRIKRFVERVEQITFNAPRALAQGHTITVVTERGIFSVTARGYQLLAVAPGINVERDILPNAPFPIHLSDALTTLPDALYRAVASGGAEPAG